MQLEQTTGTTHTLFWHGLGKLWDPLRTVTQHNLAKTGNQKTFTRECGKETTIKF